MTAVLEPTAPADEAWALVERAQAGDGDAFADLYRRYHPVILRYVLHRVHSMPLAEDLAHDVFVRALRNIGAVTWQGRDIGAWLSTIARNRVLDHFKSSRHRLELTVAEPEDGPAADDLEQTVIGRLDNLELAEALTHLTDEQREVIRLRFLRGLDIAETAALTGRAVGSVKSLQYRAIRVLAHVLKERTTR